MKTIFKLTTIIVIAFAASVNAQKMAYININELLPLMPDYPKAQSSLETYQKGLETQLQGMYTEYQTKVDEYQSQESIMTDPVKKDKQKAIADLEARIKDFQASSEQDLQKKRAELLQPVYDKAKKAIEEVAKENGYKNVIDSVALLYMDPADDLMPMVKKKLNITATTVPVKEKAPEKEKKEPKK